MIEDDSTIAFAVKTYLNKHNIETIIYNNLSQAENLLSQAEKLLSLTKKLLLFPSRVPYYMYIEPL